MRVVVVSFFLFVLAQGGLGAESELGRAARLGKLDEVKRLVEKGASVADEDSVNLLTYAVSNNNFEMLKYFIGLGVPVTGANSKKATPLHSAAEYYKDSLDSVKLLVEKGADVNAVDKDGKTPAHYAAKNGHWQVIEYLGDNTKANLYAEDNEKKTPYNIATSDNWSGHAREYLESWARKNGQKPA